MKPLALLLALVVAGCASTAPPDDAWAMDARADSLLALPPDSLSSAEWEWLRLYQQRKAEPAITRAELESSTHAAATAAVVGVLILAGVAVFWLSTQSE